MRISPKILLLLPAALLVVIGYGCGPLNKTAAFPGYYKMLFLRNGSLYRINADSVTVSAALEGKTGTYASPSFYNDNRGNTYCFIYREGDSSFLYKSVAQINTRITISGYPAVLTCRWRPYADQEIAVTARDTAGVLRVLRINTTPNASVLEPVVDLTDTADLRWNNDGTMLFIMQRKLKTLTGGKGWIYKYGQAIIDGSVAVTGCGVLAQTDALSGTLLVSSQICGDQNSLVSRKTDSPDKIQIPMGLLVVNGFAYNGSSLFFSENDNKLLSVSPAELQVMKDGSGPQTFEELIPYECAEVFQETLTTASEAWVFYLTPEGDLVRYKLNDDPNNMQSLKFTLNAPGLTTNDADIAVWPE
jgi:hypothetical protein